MENTREMQYAMAIRNTRSFKQLYLILETIGIIKIPQRIKEKVVEIPFTTFTIKEAIKKAIITEDPRWIRTLPNIYGLREKVDELIEKTKARIRDAEGFENLFLVIRKIGRIQGSSQDYDAEYLIKRIGFYRETGNENDLMKITKSFGLRNKVKKLGEEVKEAE